MNERDIFLAAIEIADPGERTAFLDQACGGNSTLRGQVDELLKTHTETSQFLETPVAATDSAFEQTILTDSSQIDDDSQSLRAPGEAEFCKYLEPATRPGWLGRLAHYEIEEILGCGAFGIVAKAFDEKLHRVVAIKMMSPELASTSPPRKRFLREARTAAAVTHENIVAIHAVEEEPIPYLVMEYISGGTLQQRMDAHGPLEVSEVLRIGHQMAAGLAAAHGANLIHRDIKPSNILLSDDSQPRAKISDFGLARAVDDATMTKSGMITGTPMYMAPEQARGETLDHRADLFNLGSVQYQMVGGRPPFRAANTMAVLKRVCEDTPRPLCDVLPGTPDWLEAIIFRLLEKKRDDRYQTAQEVADLLARCLRELEHNGKVSCVAAPSGMGEQRKVQTNESTVIGTKTKFFGWLVGGLIAVAAVIGLVTMNGEKQPVVPDKTSTNANMPSATLANASGWHGWPANAPLPAVAPFDAKQAAQHQQAWADHLNLPVEYENSIGMKFRLIPPGEFLMGSTAEEVEAAHRGHGRDEFWRDWINSEAPQHKVILTKPVYVAVTEVTQAQYEQVIGNNPSHHSDSGNGKEVVAGLESDNHPVEMVNWNDAAEFCAKLSQREKLKPFYFRSDEMVTPLKGTGYRLLTEAEWEFACRAGTTTRFWSGDQDDDLVSAGWYVSNAGRRTHAVGELNPNPFGLSDLHGNVREWVQDSWEPSYYANFSEEPAIDPNCTFSTGPKRIIRGGDWASNPAFSRSANRYAGHPEGADHFLGIRVALVVESLRDNR